MYQNQFIGELLGKLLLILFGCGVCGGASQKASKSYNSGWIAITAGWGFAVMIEIFVSMASGSQGGDINPVTTLMKYCLGKYESGWMVVAIIIAQLIGAFLGAVLVWLVYLQHWHQTESRVDKLSVFATTPAINNGFANYLSEA